MSLDIGLAGSERPDPLTRAEPVVSFDDDENGGYYWFLHPLFCNLAKETGQYIDLYGDAEFRGNDRRLLRETLLEARRQVATQPEQWFVHVGTQTAPTTRDLLKQVDRATFLRLIDSLIALVDRSVETGLPVVCLGD
jgi:hypothetical protein